MSSSERKGLQRQNHSSLLGIQPDSDVQQATNMNNKVGMAMMPITPKAEQTQARVLNNQHKTESSERYHKTPTTAKDHNLGKTSSIEKGNKALAVNTSTSDRISQDSPHKVTLKVQVDDAALHAGQFRRAHEQRVRKPSEKVRQNHEIKAQSMAGTDDTSRSQTPSGVRQRKPVAVTPAPGAVLGGTPVRSRGRPRKSAPRKKKNSLRNTQKEDEDSEYKGSTPKRQRTKDAVAVQDLANDGDEEQEIEENDHDIGVNSDEVTIADFEAPSAYGFPMRVVRKADGDTVQTYVANPAFRETSAADTSGQQSQYIPPNSGSSMIHAGSALNSQTPYGQTPREEYQQMIETSAFPNTPEFWMDWFYAEQAYRTKNIDIKQMCLDHMKAREAADIPKITVDNPLAEGSIYFFGERIELVDADGNSPSRAKLAELIERRGLSEEARRTGRIRVRDLLPPYGVDSRKDPNDPNILLTYTDWDVMLASAKLARKEMLIRREWKLKRKSDEAKWAVWGFRQKQKAKRKASVELAHGNNGDQFRAGMRFDGGDKALHAMRAVVQELKHEFNPTCRQTQQDQEALSSATQTDEAWIDKTACLDINKTDSECHSAPPSSKTQSELLESEMSRDAKPDAEIAPTTDDLYEKVDESMTAVKRMLFTTDSIMQMDSP